MLDFLLSDDVWFYCLVAMSVLLRVLYFDTERPTIKSAFYSTLAAFVVAKTFTEPTLDIIPVYNSEKYRDALVVAYALTGNEVLRGLIYAVKNPRSAIEAIKAAIWKKG